MKETWHFSGSHSITFLLIILKIFICIYFILVTLGTIKIRIYEEWVNTVEKTHKKWIVSLAQKKYTGANTNKFFKAGSLCNVSVEIMVAKVKQIIFISLYYFSHGINFCSTE